jgi:hypothetical protein
MRGNPARGERGVSSRILVIEDEANIAEYLVIGLRETTWCGSLMNDS